VKHLKIKLRVDVLERLQTEKKWTDTELAKQMGISRSRLWRAKLPESHSEYCSPGESLIIGVLKAFPERKFDDLFFLDDACSQIHNSISN
jgi:transcriptional regulator with XRE-family HTH domain